MPVKTLRFLISFAVLIVLTLITTNASNAQVYHSNGAVYHSVPVQQFVMQNGTIQYWYPQTVQYAPTTYRVPSGTVVSNRYPVYGTPVTIQNNGFAIRTANSNRVIHGNSHGAIQGTNRQVFQPVYQQSYPTYSSFGAPVCVGGT